jgi:hypothetical protein
MTYRCPSFDKINFRRQALFIRCILGIKNVRHVNLKLEIRPK